MNDGGLKALYPFLDGAPPGKADLEKVLLHSIAEKARDSRVTNECFFADAGPMLISVARTIATAFQSGGKLLTMGNGGSSCDASHVAVEFQHPVVVGRRALPAINLAADTAMISAVGNDLGFESVFVRQLLSQGRRGDVLLGISTSGNSANLLAAFSKAREMGIATIGLAGGGGGRMNAPGLLDHCLVVRSDSIHRVQESHVVAYHILWELVHAIMGTGT